MKRFALTAAAIGLAAAVALPMAASARPGGMHHGGFGPGGFGPGGFGGGPMRMCDDQEARVAGMLAFAKEKLDITQQQESAWTKFADTVRSSQKPLADACAALKDQDKPAATLPERLERMQTMMSARAAQMETVVPAVTEMYGQLTDDQKKTVDTMMRHGPMRGPGGPGAKGGPMGGPGAGPQDGSGRQGG